MKILLLTALLLSLNALISTPSHASPDGGANLSASQSSEMPSAPNESEFDMAAGNCSVMGTSPQASCVRNCQDLRHACALDRRTTDYQCSKEYAYCMQGCGC